MSISADFKIGILSNWDLSNNKSTLNLGLEVREVREIQTERDLMPEKLSTAGWGHVARHMSGLKEVS